MSPVQNHLVKVRAGPFYRFCSKLYKKSQANTLPCAPVVEWYNPALPRLRSGFDSRSAHTHCIRGADRATNDSEFGRSAHQRRLVPNEALPSEVTGRRILFRLRLLRFPTTYGNSSCNCLRTFHQQPEQQTAPCV
jgi:hypothetical protein